MNTQSLLKRLVASALFALLLLAVGCAHTGDGNESDIPWNTPQAWESSPSIPGLNDGM
ncbi:MAG: hypothetical protein PHP44_12535 [Kiritimatiellae bacterium]|nr:hypothetical protein [Kiritimatiellia bacterium]